MQNRQPLRPKKQLFQSGSKRDQLQKYIVKTLGGGDLRQAVSVPIDASRQEWLAVNTVDFYNQILLLFSLVSDFCTRDSCPSMTASPKYEYLWADGKISTKPTKCTAPDYIENVLNWVERCLDDPAVFPMSDDFPSNFEKTVKQIFKRLFRFYAHVYHNHIKQLEEVREDRHFNTCFKHFILFVTEFNLVDAKELQPLANIVQQILEQNPREA
ncbi:putative Mps one binder kinase activator-like 1A [Cladochytrium replicatum]|nr:putative Mps one binder kinase activator-like 1A [Cladochytrium replicatum]